mmetsp:Transcript_16291/g.35331  ORF Transcript_16291/g.35331 Transcript_16291/m.35331 type:complete len:551 (-) Transcript_16291:191-1843(-)
MPSQDFLHLATNAKALKALSSNSAGNDKVLFSLKVIKVNRKGKSQSRALLVTNRHVLNLMPDNYSKCNRCINIERLHHISTCSESKEFVLHVSGEYDYRFKTNNYDEAVAALASAYQNAVGEKLEVSDVSVDDLAKQVMTKTSLKMTGATWQPTPSQKLATTASAKIEDDANDSEEEDLELESGGPGMGDQAVVGGAFAAGKSRFAAEDFECLKVLGKGAFGKVMLVKAKEGSGEIYAMKVLSKQLLLERNEVVHTKTERKALEDTHHPYLVHLRFAFQTPSKLYLVMDYCNGGELFYHLKNSGRFSEERARLYAAEITSALDHLHSRRIVYRDLKPANVLVDAEGHLRVVDMGMAAKLDPDGRRKSVCGTARYMAPEMKDKKPYTTTVDWYSLGKLLVDFRGKGAGRVQPGWWEPSRLVELIDGLLIKDPAVRLGSGPDGLRQIQRSLFFAGVDWPAIDARRAPSPLRPEMYVRAPDVSASRQFRNGEDLAQVVEKLQHISLDTGSPVDSGIDGESHPGMLSDWEHVDTRSVYTEYLQSPYHNAKTSGL